MIMAFGGSFAGSQARVAENAFGKAKRIFALGLITLLAACQAVVPRGGDVPTSKPAVDPANIVASDSDRHLVALLLPVSGPDGDIGQSIANATTLALLDTKNSSIRMTTYDTALGVEVAARRAVADGNKLILGPLRGDNVVTVAGIAAPAGVPIISFSNDIGVAGQNVFLMGHLPGQSIDRVVNYAKSQGLTNFGGIVTKDVYGQRALSNLTTAVRNAGGRLAGIEEIADNSRASIDAATKRLRARGAVDAVLVATGASTALAIIPSIRNSGLKNARVLGTDRWNIDTSLASNTAAQGAWFASVSDVLYHQYATKYRTRYGTAPSRLSSLGYDAVLLTARVAQDWQIGTRFPVARLTKPDGFIGIDGAFRFLPNGKSERMLEVQEVQKGQYVTIDAAPKAFVVNP